MDRRKATRTVALLILIGLCMATPVFGKGKRESSGSVALRKVDQTSFTFVTLHDPLLFPETAYTINPAAITRLSAAATTSTRPSAPPKSRPEW